MEETLVDLPPEQQEVVREALRRSSSTVGGAAKKRRGKRRGSLVTDNDDLTSKPTDRKEENEIDLHRSCPFWGDGTSGGRPPLKRSTSWGGLPREKELLKDEVTEGQEPAASRARASSLPRGSRISSRERIMRRNRSRSNDGRRDMNDGNFLATSFSGSATDVLDGTDLLSVFSKSSPDFGYNSIVEDKPKRRAMKRSTSFSGDVHNKAKILNNDEKKSLKMKKEQGSKLAALKLADNQKKEEPLKSKVRSLFFART
jgi:hypothetical protein